MRLSSLAHSRWSSLPAVCPNSRVPVAHRANKIVATRRHAVDEDRHSFWLREILRDEARARASPPHACRANRCCVNTLQQALDICDALDPDANGALGVAVDVYHTWWDPGLQTRFAGRDAIASSHSMSATGWSLPTIRSKTAA